MEFTITTGIKTYDKFGKVINKTGKVAKKTGETISTGVNNYDNFLKDTYRKQIIQNMGTGPVG